MLRQKINRQLPRVRRIGFAVTGLVVGVLEGMPGIVVDLDLNIFSRLLHGSFELVHIVGSNSLILRAKQAEDGRVDLLQSFGVGSEMAVIDHVGSERGLIERNV